MIAAQINFHPSSAGTQRTLAIYHYNASDVQQGGVAQFDVYSWPSGGYVMTAMSKIVDASAGDYFVVKAYQDSGNSLNASTYCGLQANRLP